MNQIQPEPEPLDELEIKTAMACVAEGIDFYRENAADIDWDEEDSEHLFNLMGTWNALEQFLAWRQKRPQRNMIGEEIGVTYD